jgi:sarcosine oxidase subunit alpha
MPGPIVSPYTGTPRSAAASALAAGEAELGSSFRLHRPRGAFCHAGWCQQCRSTLSDGRIVLACQTNEPALRHSRPLRRLIGRLAERLPPWFYEHRLLRPGFLRQFYLERLRRLSAAPQLPASPAGGRGSWRERRCDVLIVGGGLAGLDAAAAQHALGKAVLLVEAEGTLGGRARYQSAKAGRLAQSIAATAALSRLVNTLCAGLYEDARQALLIGPEGPVIAAFDELIIATGAYDRLPGFAGNDLPGIVGLRAFERLVAAGAVASHWRVGVFADARGVGAAAATGHPFAWIASPDELPVHGPSYISSTTLIAAEGRRRVCAVRFDPGGRRTCDLLVLGFSQPTYELQMQAGQQATLAGAPAIVVPVGETLIAMSVVGSASGNALNVVRPVARPSGEAFLCLCEDVRRRDAEAAIADGFNDVELLKRRTGAGTGPCQGKLCHGEMLACLAAAGRPIALPTVRPLLRPVTLSQLAAADHA